MSPESDSPMGAATASPAPGRAMAYLPALFGLTLFVSAGLLFVVQPMVGKMLLPLLGGTPAVWNTALVFFQSTLLAGYFYAFALSRWLAPPRQAIVHVLVLAAVLIALPIAVPAGWAPPSSGSPIPWLLATLSITVGAPFFALSASAPLLQRWFSHSGHSAAHDPYFLYSASNLGGLIALLVYPTLVEPRLRLAEQSWSWAAGFILLLLLTAACGLFVRGARKGERPAPEDGVAETAPTPLSSRAFQRGRWILLAFVPTALLLGVTNFITTDVAAFPLLWVVPLALYLITFSIVFARRPIARHDAMTWAQPVLVMPLALWFFWRFDLTLLQLFSFHLLAFFAAAMVCHGELARTRPAAHRLTEFYLLISVGGVLGGAFAALLAPRLFDLVIEYPVAVVLACLLLPDRSELLREKLGPRKDRAVWVGALVLFGALASVMEADRNWGETAGWHWAGLVGLGLLGWILAPRPPLYGAAVAAVIALGLSESFHREDVIYQDRSYFGVYRVERQVEGDHRYHVFFHGTTIHGIQDWGPDARSSDSLGPTPIAYYYPQGPVGQFFEVVEERPGPQRVAVFGLGAGAIACHGRPEDHWTFYEIDPLVERVARDQRLFTYVGGCAPRTDVVIGDARLTIADAPPGGFDVIVLDAFSSDAIPAHLLTREAIDLYLSKLAPDGLMLFHVTNRHIDLAPVLARASEALGLVNRMQSDKEPPVGEENLKFFATDWVVLARRVADLGTLGRQARWQPIEKPEGGSVWTDDFSNLFQAVDWLEF